MDKSRVDVEDVWQRAVKLANERIADKAPKGMTRPSKGTLLEPAKRAWSTGARVNALEHLSKMLSAHARPVPLAMIAELGDAIDHLDFGAEP
ncbi:MAG: hypothetical protein HY791_03045 [Deltaproteobacteria bacterium]|nr:hypothetical protein [Deltaproteobacteria bacterium]